MQPVDLTKFPNSSGWYVAHDAGGMSYFIKSEAGRVRPGCWTHRVLAEKALFDYLTECSRPPKPVGRPKKNDN